MYIGKENFWLKRKADQLEKELTESVIVIEQLKVKVKEQELIIKTLNNSVKEELNKLKSALASMIDMLDEKLENMSEEDTNDLIEKLDEDLTLEDKIETEHIRVVDLIKNKHKSNTLPILIEMMNLAEEQNFKEMKFLLEKCGIDSNLPDLLEQYQQEFDKDGCE